MDAFVTRYDTNEKLYADALTEIKGIKFTFREIDVIACIMHSRGEKKIASLLLLSPRTVSAHVYNIMNKLGHNSKDQIIDFIEGSGKLPLIKTYYLHLLLRANFERQLAKIKNYLNKRVLYCSYIKEDVTDINNALYQSIIKHLKLANIELKESSEEPSLPRVELTHIAEEGYYRDLLKVISSILLVGPANQTDQAAQIARMNEIIQEFEEMYKNIIEIQDSTKTFDQGVKKTNTKYLILFGVIGISVLTFFVVKDAFYVGAQQVQDKILETPKVVADMEELIGQIKQMEFSANNTSDKQASLNHSAFKKVEKLLEYQNIKEVQEYLSRAEMSSTVLVDYLYNIQALSFYYIYHMYNGDKARELLLYGKSLAESYVNARSGVNTNFDTLSGEEVYSELKSVKDLPEIYARLIYGIVRTYIYNRNINNLDSRRYTELAKYLGYKLGLFDGYLGERSDLTIQQKDAEALMRSNKSGAKKMLLSLIDKFNKQSEDNNTYILDYNPNNEEQKTIIPANDAVGLFINELRIVECYKDLIEMAGTTEELEANIKDLVPHILQAKAISQKAQTRNLAALLNLLGDITLDIYTKDIDSAELIKALLLFDIIDSSNKQQPIAKNLFNISELLFEKAKSISRNTDFAKADALSGLVKVNQIKLSLAKNQQDKTNIENTIKDLEQKRDEINTKLKRKGS